MTNFDRCFIRYGKTAIFLLNVITIIRTKKTFYQGGQLITYRKIDNFSIKKTISKVLNFAYSLNNF